MVVPLCAQAARTKAEAALFCVQTQTDMANEAEMMQALGGVRVVDPAEEAAAARRALEAELARARDNCERVTVISYKMIFCDYYICHSML